MCATLGIIAGVAVPGSGCGSDDDQKSTQAATTPATSAAADPTKPYLGSYTGAEMDGFKLTLNRDGTYSVRNGLSGDIDKGQYRDAGGHQLVFTKSIACDAHGPGKGTYAYSVNGNKLVLKLSGKETGGCTGRTGYLTIPSAWVRTGGS